MHKKHIVRGVARSIHAKDILKFFSKHKMLNGMLRGFGGALVASIAWKLGSDAYDYVKARGMKAREERAEEAATEES